jgi:hypothetical protein
MVRLPQFGPLNRGADMKAPVPFRLARTAPGGRMAGQSGIDRRRFQRPFPKPTDKTDVGSPAFSTLGAIAGAGSQSPTAAKVPGLRPSAALPDPSPSSWAWKAGAPDGRAAWRVHGSTVLRFVRGKRVSGLGDSPQWSAVAACV